MSDDVASLLASFVRICWLLMSSAVFRLLLSDTLSVLRNVAATAAVEVDGIATQVASAAEHVEDSVRASRLSVQGALDAVQEAKEDFSQLREEEKQRLLDLRIETADKLAHDFVLRVQQVGTSMKHTLPNK